MNTLGGKTPAYNLSVVNEFALPHSVHVHVRALERRIPTGGHHIDLSMNESDNASNVYYF